jgi:hypothetical protein
MSAKRPTFVRGGLTCLLDRSRGYLVNATPEEYVRQETLDWLIDDLKIPRSRVLSEFNQRKRGGSGRADIVVLAPKATGDAGRAVLVVECKRNDVYLDEKVKEQGTQYARELGARVVLLTNGCERVAYGRDGQDWRLLKDLPSWRQMLAGTGLRWQEVQPFERWDWQSIATKSAALKTVDEQELRDFIVGKDSDESLASFTLNLFGLLADDSGRPDLPLEDAEVVVLRDLGTHNRTFGNSAGGTWSSDSYRSFLIREKRTGSHQVVSITVCASMSVQGHPHWGNRLGMTYLLVAVDEGATSHVSLEMRLDDTVTAADLMRGTICLRHNGSLTAGKGGAVKRDAVLNRIKLTAPDMVKGGFVVLGSLPTAREITWNDASPFVQNVIRYGLLRDKLRVDIKKERAGVRMRGQDWDVGDKIAVRWTEEDGTELVYDPCTVTKIDKKRGVFDGYTIEFPTGEVGQIDADRVEGPSEAQD